MSIVILSLALGFQCSDFVKLSCHVDGTILTVRDASYVFNEESISSVVGGRVVDKASGCHNTTGDLTYILDNQNTSTFRQILAAYWKPLYVAVSYLFRDLGKVELRRDTMTVTTNQKTKTPELIYVLHTVDATFSLFTVTMANMLAVFAGDVEATLTPNSTIIKSPLKSCFVMST